MAETQPTQLDNLVQMITAMREEMNTRLARLEQQLQRMAAVRNIHPQPTVQEGNNIPGIERDLLDHHPTPDPPHQEHDHKNIRRDPTTIG